MPEKVLDISNDILGVLVNRSATSEEAMLALALVTSGLIVDVVGRHLGRLPTQEEVTPLIEKFSMTLKNSTSLALTSEDFKAGFKA